MEQLFDLLKYIYAIRFYSKDIHYNAKGYNFWGDHLLADKVFDGLDGLIDQFNETIYMGYGNLPPSGKDVLNGTGAIIPEVSSDITQCWKSLYDLIGNCLDIIADIREEFDDPAMSSLLDTIAQDIRAKKGLVWRRIFAI